MPVEAPGRALAHRLVARNSFYGFLGQAAQVAAIAVFMPMTVRLLGTSRIGVLSVIWALVGYFSVLDIGIGRAVTQAVASAIGARARDRVRSIFWSAVSIQVMMGAAGAMLLIALSHSLVRSVLHVPPELASEAYHSTVLAALSLPGVFFAGSLIGILQAENRFDLVTAVTAPASVVNQIVPVVIALRSPNLVLIVAALVATRILSALALSIAAARVYRGLFDRIQPVPSQSRALLRFGGWLSVSNIISPVFVYLDRLLISTVLTVAVVAYYVIPFEAVMRLLVVSNCIAAALFPILSAKRTDAEGRRLLGGAAKAIFVLVGVPVCALLMIGRDALHLWLGPEFAARSTAVLQILACGVFLNALAALPYSALQAAGRPDLTAKLHLIELVPHCLSLWPLIHFWGLAGAAFGWTLRAGVDCLLLVIVLGRVNGIRPLEWIRPVAAPAAAGALLGAASFASSGEPALVRAACLCGIGAIAAVYLAASGLLGSTAGDRQDGRTRFGRMVRLLASPRA